MPKEPKQSRARSWCFTLNNPTAEDDKKFSEEIWEIAGAKYLIMQKEKGENGTPHFQGYITFSTPKTLKAVRTIMSTAHWEIARGSADENRTYCSKEVGRQSGPFEYGTIPSQGKRNDLAELQSDIDTGSSIREISEKHFSNFIRYRSGILAYKLLHTPQRNWPMEVVVLHGPTGCGKSKHCQDNYPGAYWKSKNSGQQQFWDGYNGEDTIIIDEFYGWLPWDYLLRLTDRYPFSLDVKHGTIQLSAKTIVFTSNKPPAEWYPNSKYFWDESNPFKRRITKIISFSPSGDSNIS